MAGTLAQLRLARNVSEGCFFLLSHKLYQKDERASGLAPPLLPPPFSSKSTLRKNYSDATRHRPSFHSRSPGRLLAKCQCLRAFIHVMLQVNKEASCFAPCRRRIFHSLRSAQNTSFKEYKGKRGLWDQGCVYLKESILFFLFCVT